MANQGSGAWDIPMLRKLGGEKRLQAEAMLLEGKSVKRVAAELGLSNPIWISAVRKNPIPGGPFDPQGKEADYRGYWVDLSAVKRKWLGLGKGGKPLVEVANPVLPEVPRYLSGRLKRDQRKKPILPVVDGAPPVKKKIGRPKGSGKKPPPPVPEPQVVDEVLDAPADPKLPGKPGRPKGSGVGPGAGRVPREIKRMRLATSKALNIETRIALLSMHAKNMNEPSVSLRAIQTLNEMDGISGKGKLEHEAARGSAPIFSLPGGTRMGVAPVGMAPIDAVVTVEDDLTPKPPPPPDVPQEPEPEPEPKPAA